MRNRILIKNKLSEQYETFLSYCSEADKRFVDELDELDFIAYRNKYAAPCDDIENIKMLMAVKQAEINLFAPFDKNLRGKQLQDNSMQTLQERFNLSDLSPYKGALLTDLPFNDRVQKSLQLNNCRTLIELLDYSIPQLLTLQNIGKESVNNILNVLENFFSNSLRRTQPISTPKFDKRNLKILVTEMINAAITNDRENGILVERVAGKTFKEISQKFNLPRERIQQFERNAVMNFQQRNLQRLQKFFDTVKKRLEDRRILTLDNLKNIIGDDAANFIWFFISRINLNQKDCYFDTSTNTLVFCTLPQPSIDYDAALRRLSPVLRKDELQEEIDRISQEQNYSRELLKFKILQTYKNTGQFYYRGQLSFIFKCSYVLRERFKSGYRLSDATHYNRFIRYLKEFFDYDGAISQETLETKISSDIGVMCDRDKYIHPDLLHIPQKIMLLINEYIGNSPRKVLKYTEIFNTLKSQFVGTQITNKYILRSVIKYCGTSYRLLKDCLIKGTKSNTVTELNNLFEKNGELSAANIEADFNAVSSTTIKKLLPLCPNVIFIGNGKYIHSTRLNLQDSDWTDIEQFLKEVCTAKPVTVHYLFNVFLENFQDFLYRNKIEDGGKLFGILKYMFNSKFHFARPYISALKITGNISKKIILNFLNNTTKIEIEDIFRFCETQGMYLFSKLSIAALLNPEFVRLNSDWVCRPNSIGITKKIIDTVIQNVKLAMIRNDGWQAAKTFPDFEWLPHLEVSWNSFLLESVVNLGKRDFAILHSSSLSSEFSTAVFISAELKPKNFNDFCLKVLINSKFSSTKGLDSFQNTKFY